MVKIAKKAFVYDGSQWVDIAQSTADLSNYANLTTTPISGFRNAIINGDFRINQRGFSSGSTGGTFMADRWYFNNQGGTGTLTASLQNFTPGTSPAGYEGTRFARIVTSGQSAVGTRSDLIQNIEDVRTFAGQTITVSFWAKSASGTPSVTVELGQYFGTGDSPSAFVSTNTKLVMTGGTSWTRYSFSYTVPSLSGKTIGSNNDHYLYLGIWVSAGSDFNARSASLGIQSNTFDFWGVQVEKGTIATPFEQRPIGTELALCQRYYWRISGNATNSAKVVGFGNAGPTTSSAAAFVNCPSPMRIVPTLIETGAMNVADQNAGTAVTGSSIVSAQSSEQFVFVAITTAGGLTSYRPYVYQLNGASSYFALGAEL